MKHCYAALIIGLLTAATARGHFVWVVPGPAGEKATVQVIFSDTLQPDDAELLKKIAQTELHVRGADGKSLPLKKYTEGKADAYLADVPGKGSRSVAAVCRYGVIQRGAAEPFLLNYYAKTFIRDPGSHEGHQLLAAAWDLLPLEIVPGKGNMLRVLWQGKPLAAAEVVILAPGKDKGVEGKTDGDGMVLLPPAGPGSYGIRVRHIENKEGEHDGKKYKEVRHYATLVVHVADKEQPGKPALAPDPTATKLLADARAARAQWENFPGFKADLDVYADGKSHKGQVEVSAKGEVNLKLAEPAVEPWVRRTLGSIAGHRLDNSAVMNTPCALHDRDADHPLGQAIRVLNDEFHSSYRVRDRQIIVVNRQMGEVRFTITVLENRLNEEQKFLPASYVVNSWDLKTDALKSSEAHHQTWKRVGKFDLPLTATVIKASAGQLDARSIRLTNHQLLP